MYVQQKSMSSNKKSTPSQRLIEQLTDHDAPFGAGVHASARGVYAARGMDPIGEIGPPVNSPQSQGETASIEAIINERFNPRQSPCATLLLRPWMSLWTQLNKPGADLRAEWLVGAKSQLFLLHGLMRSEHIISLRAEKLLHHATDSVIECWLDRIIRSAGAASITIFLQGRAVGIGEGDRGNPHLQH